MTAVAFGGPASAASTGGRTKLQTNHGEGALAVFDEKFGQKDFAEALHVKPMALLGDTGTVGFDGFDAGAKKNSILIGRRQVLPGLKRVHSYLPKF